MTMSSFCILIIVFGFIGGCICDCPDGFVSHQGSCYKTFGILANWREAQTYCDAYGGYLLEISDDYEQHFITGFLQRLGRGSFNAGVFWLGGTDSGHEGHWLWSKTRGPFTVTYWKTGEPNNAGSEENCLQMAFSDGLLWNDGACANRLNFICESSKYDQGGIIIG